MAGLICLLDDIKLFIIIKLNTQNDENKNKKEYVYNDKKDRNLL